MPYFIEQIKTSYENIPKQDGIETEPFLAATEDFVKIFDFLGSSAFAPVKSDMTGNIKKIRDKFETDRSKYRTLQQIVSDESALAKDKRTATTGLLWLRRGLEFTSLALRRNFDDSKEELSTSFSKAYEQTLQKHHNMLVRPIFHLAMKACPYRRDFYKKLAESDSEAVTIGLLKPWLAGLEECVDILIKFYAQGKYEV